MESMRRHWREVHEFSIWNQAGRPNQLAEDPQQLLAQAYQLVSCYRLFPSRWGSHYIEVRTEDLGCDQESRGEPAAISDLIQDLEDSYQQEQEQREHVIEAGEMDEANPWLRRTQWPQYLQGLNGHDLLILIEPPSLVGDLRARHPTARHPTARHPTAPRDPLESNQEDLQLLAIWEAMAGLIQTSQVVASQQGNLIWMAAIRTEQHQNRYQPLQAYMNQESIQHHMLPWQQIIMFFACTQMEPTEETPGYQFTWRQQKT